MQGLMNDDIHDLAVGIRFFIRAYDSKHGAGQIWPE